MASYEKTLAVWVDIFTCLHVLKHVGRYLSAPDSAHRAGDVKLWMSVIYTNNRPINTVGVKSMVMFWHLSDRVCCPFSIIEIRYIKLLRTRLELSVNCVHHIVRH